MRNAASLLGTGQHQTLCACGPGARLLKHQIKNTVMLFSAVSDGALKTVLVAGLWFALGAGVVSAIAAALSGFVGYELSSRSDKAVADTNKYAQELNVENTKLRLQLAKTTAAVSNRTLTIDNALKIKEAIAEAKFKNINIQGADEFNSDKSDLEVTNFLFSLRNAFGQGGADVTQFLIPSGGALIGSDINLYIPGIEDDFINKAQKDPIYNALRGMGFNVALLSYALDDLPNYVVQTNENSHDVKPRYYNIYVNHRPPSQIGGPMYWGMPNTK